MNNAVRAKRAFDLISGSESYGDKDLHDAVLSLLIDLAHLGEMNGMDMNAMLDEMEEVMNVYSGTDNGEEDDDDDDDDDDSFEDDDDDDDDLDEDDDDEEDDEDDEDDDDLGDDDDELDEDADDDFDE